MLNEIVVITLILLLSALLWWSFTFLSREGWQFIASVPVKKRGEGQWQGLNFTYYGFFNAMAVTLASAMGIILLAACGIPTLTVIGVIISILALCVPAARLVAGWVEKKRYTFSIGGASFVGLLGAPWIILLFRAGSKGPEGSALQPIVVLSAIVVAYALGEGVGRLACISFGCCYGKPIDTLHPALRRLFYRIGVSFYCPTRKAVYADHLAGVRLVPIQAITSVINCLAAVAGMYLFLTGRFAAAFLVSMMLTQLWRVASEFLRADYRGNGRLSAYQWMALSAIPYSLLISRLFTMTGSRVPDVAAGFQALWHPAVLINLQLLWILVFIYFGKSRVTESSLSFHVVRDRV
ncbi:MAG: prolipoprotein diacylglyceryl transferase [Desulfobacterales bacterium]|jgi:hypothetical protein|nr:prolipoprotein diacylglyceryl transferase [Desulfobacterales bacterium]